MKQKFPEPIVGGLIFNKKGELLLVKSPKWLNRYSIPGGHIEVGEDFLVQRLEGKLKKKLVWTSKLRTCFILKK